MSCNRERERERECFQAITTILINHRVTDHPEEGQDLFSIIPECRTRENGLKLQETRYRLNIRKTFLTVRAVQQWKQWSREVVSAQTLEAFKRKLDHCLSDLLGFGFLH